MKTIITNNKYFNYFKKQLHKIVVVLVMVSMFSNALIINRTSAFYNDTETSSENYFSAAFLDFILTNNELTKNIGTEALGEISHASVIMPVDGSLPMQYDLNTSIDALTSDINFCNGLIVEAKLNGITKYNGLLPGLTNTTTTEFGSWEFRFDLPPTVSIPNNVKCNASILFSAWRADIANKANSSWHDEEVLNISLTSRMVVLNEIYARPNSAIAPKNREYIELYNNSNAPVDVLGWQISEIAGTTETFYPVVALGAVPGQIQPYNGASTIIPSKGFLVLEFGGSTQHLNDTGDTIKLYDGASTLLDSHIYPGIQAGKAIVRFPDGIGFWVDPEATPGTENAVSMEDLRSAGFSEDMIEEVLKLMAITNTTLSDTTESEKIENIPVEENVVEEQTAEEPKVEEPVIESEVEEEQPAEEVVGEQEESPAEEIIEQQPQEEEEITQEEVVEEVAEVVVPEEEVLEEQSQEETQVEEVIEEQAEEVTE